MSSMSTLRVAKNIGHLAAASALVAIGAASPTRAAVVISSGATKNIACASGVCTPTAKFAVLNVGQLESLLASGKVKVTTGGARASDITVTAALSWASSNRLALTAYRSITINRAVAVNGTGALLLVTNNGGTGGTLSFGRTGQISFLSTANNLTINGVAYTLVADTTTLASDIASNPGGDFALASDYNATGNPSFVITTFTGSFEGLGNAISNLSLVASNDNFGLFAQLGSGGAITDVRLTTSAISGGYQAIGALVGWNEGYLSGDSASGTLVETDASGGGLVGTNQGTIVDCSSTIKLSADDKRGSAELGGLVGINDPGGTIDSSYASGHVTSKGQDADGGLVGLNEGSISNSYSTGSATGIAYVGGLVGGNQFNASTDQGTISNSYSTGAVEGASGSTVGGFMGRDAETGGATNSYWDTTTSGITNPAQGAGNVNNDPGITGLTTAQLQAGLPSGFDPTIWGESPSINDGLPYLLALPPPA
jgi:hypothetical protein